MKKLLAHLALALSVLALVICGVVVSPRQAFAAEPFTDVDSETPHYEDIVWMADNGISTGFEDGTFRPYDDIARCDMAAFLYRLAGSPAFTPTVADKAKFNDVDSDTPHATEIWWLASVGISTGFEDHTFRPYDPVARCDMAAFLYRLSGSPAYTPTEADKTPFSDVDSETPHANEIWWLESAGIATGFEDGTFRPYDSVARCDMAAFLHRVYDKGVEPPSGGDSDDSWAQRIDAFNEGTPLAGYGAEFSAAAAYYGVDPRIAPAIARLESSSGTYCFRPYNAWGWGSVSWPDWKTAIWEFTEGYSDFYGSTVTLEGAQRYCPLHAELWYEIVTGYMNEI